VSIAEVWTVRLEVEQPLHANELKIRVRDWSAHAHSQEKVSCEIHYLWPGKQFKVGNVTLKQESPASDKYVGVFSDDRGDFGHGTIAKVIYKSPGLSQPISTWCYFFFH